MLLDAGVLSQVQISDTEYERCLFGRQVLSGQGGKMLTKRVNTRMAEEWWVRTILARLRGV